MHKNSSVAIRMGIKWHPHLSGLDVDRTVSFLSGQRVLRQGWAVRRRSGQGWGQVRESFRREKDGSQAWGVSGAHVSRCWESGRCGRASREGQAACRKEGAADASGEAGEGGPRRASEGSGELQGPTAAGEGPRFWSVRWQSGGPPQPPLMALQGTRSRGEHCVGPQGQPLRAQRGLCLPSPARCAQP